MSDQVLSSHNLGRQVFGSPDHVGNIPREEWALSLLNDWVENPKLRLHCRQVAALMAAWAEEVLSLPEQDVLKWKLAGLLHDADWDKWPSEHCRRIVEHLEVGNYDPELIHAIACHSPAFFGVEPKSDMDCMLYAFDELSGFIHAVSLVRPKGYEGMSAKSVKKKLKDKGFAAQVNRSDISDALSRIKPSLDELIGFAILHQSKILENL